MNEPSSIEDCSPSIILLRAHDHIWSDKQGFDWKVRFEACDEMWRLALELAKEGK